MIEPRSYPLRDLALLLAVALFARVVAAWLVPAPPYTDAAYYTVVAERLADDRGFTVPVVWSFLEVGGSLPADPELPVPSNRHWLPLASLVAAASMWLFDDGWRAGQVPMVLLSAALVGVAHMTAWELWRSRRSALIAALLAVFAGPLLVMFPLVETFAVYGVAGALALFASMRAAGSRTSRPGWWLVAAGALVGVATLARIDGLLLAIAPLAAWWIRGRPLWPLVVGFSLFALVLAPWLVRNQLVFGAPLPSAGGHTLWITSYNEQFSIGHEVSLSAYLASGPWAIVSSKLAALGELLGRTLNLAGGIMGVIGLAGLWVLRARSEVRVFTSYWLVMWLVMGLVFTFHGPKGAFVHAAAAWLPALFAIAAGGVAPVASSVSRLWRFLGRSATHRFLEVAGVAAAVILSVASSALLVGQWRTDNGYMERAATFLRGAAEPDDVTMSVDPARLYLMTGNPGVAAPFDPYPVIAEVVDAYDVGWLVVTLDFGAERDPLGLWEGAAARDSEGNHPDFLPAQPAFEAPGVRVFRVE